MSVFVSLLLTLRDVGRSRATLELKVLALRHQLHVLKRSHARRLRLTRIDRLLWVWFSRVWSQLPFATIRTGRLVVAPFLVETTQSACAGDDPRTRSRAGVGLPRTSRIGPREPRAPPATDRIETHGRPFTSPETRPAVLDRNRPDVAELACGARARQARHRGAMASRMASPAMDAAFGADSCGPPKDQRRHSYPRAQDGRRESALGSASDPWRVAETGRRGLGANGLATAPGVGSACVTNVAHVSDESRQPADLDRFLHRTDLHGQSPVRPRRADASPPADRSRQRHRASDGGVDGPTDH